MAISSDGLLTYLGGPKDCVSYFMVTSAIPFLCVKTVQSERNQITSLHKWPAFNYIHFRVTKCIHCTSKCMHLSECQKLLDTLYSDTLTLRQESLQAKLGRYSILARGHGCLAQRMKPFRRYRPHGFIYVWSYSDLTNTGLLGGWLCNVFDLFLSCCSPLQPFNVWHKPGEIWICKMNACIKRLRDECKFTG